MLRKISHKDRRPKNLLLMTIHLMHTKLPCFLLNEKWRQICKIIQLICIFFHHQNPPFLLSIFPPPWAISSSSSTLYTPLGASSSIFNTIDEILWCLHSSFFFFFIYLRLLIFFFYTLLLFSLCVKLYVSTYIHICKHVSLLYFTEAQALQNVNLKNALIFYIHPLKNTHSIHFNTT